jgi:hypothetical protein
MRIAWRNGTSYTYHLPIIIPTRHFYFTIPLHHSVCIMHMPTPILHAIQAAYVRHTRSWCWPGAWAQRPSAHRHAQQGGLEVCAAGQAAAAGGAGEGSHGATVSSSGSEQQWGAGICTKCIVVRIDIRTDTTQTGRYITTPQHQAPTPTPTSKARGADVGCGRWQYDTNPK